MTTSRIRVSGIPVEVVRKGIKNIHLAVYPPHGRVRIAVPTRVTDDAVRMAVVSRIGWIRRRQAGFEAQDRQSPREMVNGETHYFQGRRHRLQVIEGNHRPEVRKTKNDVLELRVRPGADRLRREQLLHDWYRSHLREQIPGLVARWEPKVGVKVADSGIKRMKTRWGTCSPGAGRIWINLELAKKSPQCLEYIVVHEMAHILEPKHNDRFREHMDRVLPQWRALRETLNQAPLANDHWEY